MDLVVAKLAENHVIICTTGDDVITIVVTIVATVIVIIKNDGL